MHFLYKGVLKKNTRAFQQVGLLGNMSRKCVLLLFVYKK